MKLKYKFTITTVMDEIVAVPIDSGIQLNGVITINETMKDIMELLAEDRTENELVNAMLNKYKNVTADEMKTVIHDVCMKLKNEGILN